MFQYSLVKKISRAIVFLLVALFASESIASYANYGNYRHTPDGKWEHKIKYRTKCYCWPFSYKNRYKCCPWAYKWSAVNGLPPNVAGPQAPEDVDNGGGGESGGPYPEPPGPKCSGPSPGNVGDPINIFTGNLFEAVHDLEFSSPYRGKLVFKRFYNSQSKRVGILGLGWTHSFSAFLKPSYEFNGETYFKIVDETGRSVYFQQQTGNYFAGAFKEKSDVVVEDGNFVWRRLDSSRFVFSAEGKLTWIEDSIGNRLAVIYTDDGYIEAVYDEASGCSIIFHYEGVHNAGSNDGETGPSAEIKKLAYLSGPKTDAVEDGVWVSYDYDQSKLLSTTYPDKSGFDYVYDDGNQLIEKKDKSGYLLSQWAYKNNKAVYNFTPDGKGVTIDYIDDNHVQVTDAYDQTRTYAIFYYHGRPRIYDISHANGCQDCEGGLTQLDYDDSMNVIRSAYSNGRVKTYSNHDDKGRPGKIVQGAGTPEEKAITLTYHPGIDEILTRTEPSLLGDGNKETIWDYDSDDNNIPNETPSRLVHRKIERGFTHDDSGAAVPYEYITAFEYTPNGQVLTIDGTQPGTQDPTTFTYNATTGDLLTVTMPLIGVTTYSEYNATGEVGRVTDTNGNARTYTYDGRGRIKTITHEAAGSTTTYDYNQAGELANVIQANGMSTDFVYDGLYGRLTRVVDPLENYIYYSYDDQGNRTGLSYFTSADERLYWKRYDYHGPTQPGKLWRVINPDNTYTEYTYDAGENINSVKDPAGKTTLYDYDILNQLTTVTQPGDVTITHAYDTHNNLVMVTDAKGHTTTYVYDDLDRLIATTSPDTGTTTYTYDAAGNLVSKTDANGCTVTYIYDILNRMTGILFSDAAQDITYTYDEGTNGKGRLTSMTDPRGSYTYTYDALGNIVAEEKTINSVTYTTEYAYDPAGILTGITYPDGRTVAYHLDSAGQVMRVTSSFDGKETTLADNVAYLPFGPITAMNLGNGLKVTESFDQLYRLQTSQGGSVYNRSYAYDPVGNLTGIDDLVDPSRTQSFGYDALNRLITASGIYGTIGYTYDQVGNRLTKTYEGATDTYSYMPGTNKLLEIIGAHPMTFTYDGNGNTTGIGDKTFIYNQNNRLIGSAENGTTLCDYEYMYNSLDQRAVKRVNGQTTIFVYDQQGNLIAEADKNGEIVNEYIYLDGRLLAQIKKGGIEILATVDIDPDTLNFKSKGRWITCYIELPEGYDVTEIDPATITLNEAIYPDRTHITDHDADGIADLMAKFNRNQVADLLEPAEEVSLKIDGEVEGIPFSGIDTIMVIDKGKKGKKNKEEKGENGISPVYRSTGNNPGANAVYYYHLDHLGTSKVMTDRNGEIVWKADYKPFGEADVTVGAISNNFRFPGQYYDEETCLHYNYHRYYEPGMGRYLRPDSSHSIQPVETGIPYLLPILLASPQELNLYHYTMNNPVNLTDPLGLLSCDGTWKQMGSDRVAMWYCLCYWLCIPCDTPVLWSSNYRNLPSTRGQYIYQGGDGLESGDRCLCEKPGPEKDCDKCE